MVAAAGASRALVIVNYRSHQLIDRNFSAVNWSELGMSMVVVDNYSDQRERTAISELCRVHNWQLVDSPQNVGFGAGVSLGVHVAARTGAATFLVVNPDVTLPSPVANELFEVAASGRHLACPKLTFPNGKVGFVGGSLSLDTGTVRTAQPVDMSLPTSWVTGACMAFGAQLWEECGGMDPDYFMYWEDVDFSMRCRHVGAQLLVRDDLVAVHEVGGTQGGGKSSLYTYYNCRNRLLFAANWLSPDDRDRWCHQTAGRSYEILRRGNGRRSLFEWAQVRAAIKGSRDGLRIVKDSPVPAPDRWIRSAE